MKYATFIVILATVASSKVTLPDDVKLELQQMAQQCQNETGVDPEVAKRRQYPENDDKLKKYYLCAYLALGFMTQNGDFVPEMMTSKLHPYIRTDRMQAIIVECTRKYPKAEESAFRSDKCFTQHKHHFQNQN